MLAPAFRQRARGADDLPSNCNYPVKDQSRSHRPFKTSATTDSNQPETATLNIGPAAIGVIQTVPSKAHYRARAAAGGLGKHSPNVCIHWKQQPLNSHDESRVLDFAPFAMRFTASRIAFG